MDDDWENLLITEENDISDNVLSEDLDIEDGSWTGKLCLDKVLGEGEDILQECTNGGILST